MTGIVLIYLYIYIYIYIDMICKLQRSEAPQIKPHPGFLSHFTGLKSIQTFDSRTARLFHVLAVSLTPLAGRQISCTLLNPDLGSNIHLQAVFSSF